MTTRGTILTSAIWSVRDGSTIPIHHELSPKMKGNTAGNLSLDKVADLINNETKNWNFSLLHSLYERSDGLHIAQQPISFFNLKDTLI